MNISEIKRIIGTIDWSSISSCNGNCNFIYDRLNTLEISQPSFWIFEGYLFRNRVMENGVAYILPFMVQALNYLPTPSKKVVYCDLMEIMYGAGNCFGRDNLLSYQIKDQPFKYFMPSSEKGNELPLEVITRGYLASKILFFIQDLIQSPAELSEHILDILCSFYEYPYLVTLQLIDVCNNHKFSKEKDELIKDQLFEFAIETEIGKDYIIRKLI